MCGILGIVSADAFVHESSSWATTSETAFETAPPAFKRALDTLARRGPDDHGIYHTPGVTLGQRRLAIVDLSHEGHQPMISADGRFVIVFNGEVYNFRELRRDLERAGVKLRSDCDTEVILELFAREGARCVERFRGMFALAIWDKRERELFLLRDRMGIKPLYYTLSAGTLAFASEVKALRTLGAAAGGIHPGALANFLIWGSVPSPQGLVEGVLSLAPGHWARFKGGELEREQYWDIPRGEVHYRSRDEALEALRPALQESVALRCIADVPLGAFLSGGIDSSAIVSLMRSVGQRDLRTFSMTFPGTELDESRYAGEIARIYETHHTAAPIDAGIVKAALADFFDVLDQPTCDGVNTYLVSRFAKQAGLTVALSGLGGDELFGGYPSFTRAQRIGPWATRVPQPGRTLVSSFASLHPRLAKLEAFRFPGDAMGQMYLASRGLFAPNQALALLSPGYRSRAQPEPLSGLPVDPDASPFHATMRLELRRYMHDQLLRDSDVFGMAHALEIRVPLIDHKVVEIVARTPAEVVLAGTQKALLRDALPQPLPALCTDRKKMGFTFPFDRWMRTSLREEIESELLACRAGDPLWQPGVEAVWQQFLAGRVHWSRPWSLYVLRRWAAPWTI
jgi:asparagine synthase (glutamine-hydrolysing)